jgi:DNA-binding transcriptional ArsR family regulator
MISEKDVENINKIKKRITCLTHPIKGRIVTALMDVSMYGNELDEYLKVEQSFGAQLRASLRKHNLVTVTQKGKYFYYRTNTDTVNQMYELCYSLCNQERIIKDQLLKFAQSRLRAINHPNRSLLVNTISHSKDWKFNQKNLVEMMGMEQSELAAQTRILISAGFVQQKKVNRNVYYKVDKPLLKQFLKTCKTAQKWQ